MEYLLAQFDQGDLRGPQQHNKLGIVLPDLQVEIQEEESLDVTIDNVADILMESQPEVAACEDQLDISPLHSPVLYGLPYYIISGNQITSKSFSLKFYKRSYWFVHALIKAYKVEYQFVFLYCMLV